MAGPDSRSFKELIEMLIDASVGEVLDPGSHRERTYRGLAEHEDPLLREIGEQLRDGVIQPRQLLDIPGYDTAVADRLALLREIDPETLRRQLADYIDSVEPNQDGRR